MGKDWDELRERALRYMAHPPSERDLNITQFCEKIGVSRSKFYSWQKEESWESDLKAARWRVLEEMDHDVTWALYRESLDGNASASKIWKQFVMGMNPNQVERDQGPKLAIEVVSGREELVRLLKMIKGSIHKDDDPIDVLLRMFEYDIPPEMNTEPDLIKLCRDSLEMRN